MNRRLALAAVLAAGVYAAPQDWPTYGGDAGGTRYSPLKQITRDNVAKLKVAWTYRTWRVAARKPALNQKAAFEATPILFEGTLSISVRRSTKAVMALDPATGAR